MELGEPGQCLGFSIWEIGFRVQGLGFQGLGFRVQGLIRVYKADRSYDPRSTASVASGDEDPARKATIPLTQTRDA